MTATNICWQQHCWIYHYGLHLLIRKHFFLHSLQHCPISMSNGMNFIWSHMQVKKIQEVLEMKLCVSEITWICLVQDRGGKSWRKFFLSAVTYNSAGCMVMLQLRCCQYSHYRWINSPSWLITKGNFLNIPASHL